MSKIPFLKKHYEQILCEDLLLKIELSNIYQIPKITSGILSTTSQRISNNSNFIINTVSGLELISGQKLLITKAKKSISTFKIREKQILGAKVTLRQNLMFYLLEKFFLVFPRCRSIKNKKILSDSYDFGFHEDFILFPEIENHYEFFEDLKGWNFHINIEPRSCHPLIKKLLLSGFYIINV